MDIFVNIQFQILVLQQFLVKKLIGHFIPEPGYILLLKVDPNIMLSNIVITLSYLCKIYFTVKYDMLSHLLTLS